MEKSSKTVVVTGGSRGLGLEIVGQLLTEGWSVVAISRRGSAELNQLSNEYTSRLEHLILDLDCIDNLRDKLGEMLPVNRVIDGLVNNAAVAYDDLISNLNMSAVESMFRINVLAAMELTRFSLRRMLVHKTRGSFVHVSSISTCIGYKGLAMYAASKGAIEAFSKNMAREWGRVGIRSNCVVPGFMETEMSRSISDDDRQKIYRRSSLGEPTQVASVAATVRFLLSDQSASITGQTIRVDAGS